MLESNRSYDGIATYKRLLSYSMPYWPLFSVALIGMVIFSIAPASFARVIEPMLDSFVNRDPKAIKWVPVLIVTIFAVKSIGSFTSDYFMKVIARNVVRDLRNIMYMHMLNIPSRYYDATSSGSIVSKMVYDVEQLADSASYVVTAFIRDTLAIIFLVAVMLYQSMELTLMLLIVVPFLFWVVAVVSKRFRKLSHRIQGSMGDVSSITEETIEANREIKIFSAKKNEIQRFHHINQYNRRQFLKLTLANAISTPVIEFMIAASFAGILVFATRPDMIEGLSPGSVMSFITSMLLLLQHARRLSTINARLQSGIAAAQSVFAFIDGEEEKDKGSKVLSDVKGKVEFRNVSFAYNSHSTPILQDINLLAEPGEMVAFVGRSGGGKTTLVSLLPRFYDLEQGEILIDDINVNDFNLMNLRSHISLVSQHVTLFNETIAYNIAYGHLDTVSEEQIRQAAAAAHALEFIEASPEGFDTVIGENGIMLSGGQRQRIAIARAIIKNAPILILDEATSALDTQLERQIQAALEELMKNRTTFVIAHRLSTIEKADKIVVFEAGRIVEQGNHHDLMEKNGTYANLHKLGFPVKRNSE